MHRRWQYKIAQYRAIQYCGIAAEGQSTMLHWDNSYVRQHLLKGNFGFEKESLRVYGDGTFSHTRDPFVSDPYIEKDFCENQVEINTGVHENVSGAIQELQFHHHRIISVLQNLPRKEYLWPCSNPPYIQNEKDIPIAQFEGNEKEQTVYREYLSSKYGRYKMTFSGIHVNFSFSEELLRADYACEMENKRAKDHAKELTFEEYKNRLYLDLAQGLCVCGWLLTSLTAASPVLDSSYYEKGVYGNDYFTGMASVRCSEMGYWNEFSPIFDYSSITSYANSIQRYVDKGILQAPRELYYPIRLKPQGKNTLSRLRTLGVDHIELRMFDLNPFADAGLDKRDVIFAQLLMIYLVSKQQKLLSDDEQVRAVQNFKNAAHFDLKVVPIITPSGVSMSVADAGLKILGNMKKFYSSLSLQKETLKGNRIEEVLNFELRKMEEPECRYAWKMRKEWKEGFVDTGLKLMHEQQDQK